MQRISTSHLIFLILVSLSAVFLNWSAINASGTLFNLIIIVPSGLIVIALALFIFFTNQEEQKTTDQAELQVKRKALIGDLSLLGLFAVFCLSLSTVGFDVATFLFVWVGVKISGAKGVIVPPVYSALFTLALIKGFGALFPFPMPLLVM